MYVFKWKANADRGLNPKAAAYPALAEARDEFMNMEGWNMPDEVWFIRLGVATDAVTVMTAGEFMDHGPWNYTEDV